MTLGQKWGTEGQENEGTGVPRECHICQAGRVIPIGRGCGRNLRRSRTSRERKGLKTTVSDFESGAREPTEA